MDQQLVTSDDQRAPAPRPRRASLLWIAGIALLVYSAAIAATGGIDVTLAGVRVRSRTWERPAVVGLACLAVVAVMDRRRAAAAARAWTAAVGRAIDAVWLGLSPRVVALAAAVWAAGAGVVFGTAIAGGADSSGYLNQARLLASGRLTDDFRLRGRLPLPDPASKIAPLGFRPTPDRQRLAPTYPPGYPLLMAPLFHLHERIVFLVVPLSGALAVWLTFAIARRLEEAGAGAAAALLLSVSPTFLYQIVQPMSDVPAVALWLLALYLSIVPGGTAAAAAGGAAALAILVRPNLAPLAAIVWTLCAVSAPAAPLRRAATAIAATVPGIVALGAAQTVRYGAPLASGYGPFRDLFAWSNVLPNLDRYPRWMFETHTPAIALFLLAPLWAVRAPRERRTAWLLLWLFAVAVLAAYLPYVYFQSWEWAYTRFLLPALPLMWLLTIVPFARLLRHRRPAAAALVAAPVIVALVAFSIAVSVRRYAFELREGERKYVLAADYVNRMLPPNALLISMQHSGSLWFYTKRPVLRWDQIDRHQLDETVVWCTSHGYAPFLVADLEELERIAERFRPARQQTVERIRRLARFGDATISALTPEGPPTGPGSAR
jgi:hypothetical protein